jgi:hypothetical protein
MVMAIYSQKHFLRHQLLDHKAHRLHLLLSIQSALLAHVLLFILRQQHSQHFQIKKYPFYLPLEINLWSFNLTIHQPNLHLHLNLSITVVSL